MEGLFKKNGKLATPFGSSLCAVRYQNPYSIPLPKDRGGTQLPTRSARETSPEMQKTHLLESLETLIDHLPTDWLNLTTHRLDIYHEELAKTEFLNELEKLVVTGSISTETLEALPTAYDYIRLGHPLSCVLEWAIAQMHEMEANSAISFSSLSMPIMAILRTNLMHGQRTLIAHQGELPADFDAEVLKRVYQYDFDVAQVGDASELPTFDGSVVFVSSETNVGDLPLQHEGHFTVGLLPGMGSILVASGAGSDQHISEIQHVRRRETIAMTPVNCLRALHELIGKEGDLNQRAFELKNVMGEIKSIANTSGSVLLGSSGLSVQYAIMMGLIDHSLKHCPDKKISFIVPTNCYGGTNDQARRVAASHSQVEVLDLLVDGDNEMVDSMEKVLEEVAQKDAVPMIIAEIPTNPRVEVPNLKDLRNALERKRKTSGGAEAVQPVFILDQTFCPNVRFCENDGILSGVQTISYVSGSKFPSGGKCTAGYVVANREAEHLMPFLEKHFKLCDNEATPHQLATLEEQLPSMLHRIEAAYRNTRDFVSFIEETLPEAKINFVPQELAAQGFTPSVFSLDLPTKGDTPEEREAHKRELNRILIDKMITEIPGESKHCVSYGQLKGVYWTVPATSTQGTTKEKDKDYIARVSVSGNVDLARHKAVFKSFVEEFITRESEVA
jgi:cystathionine beta-lyase/cystathionine gamma-synthase